MPDITNMEAVRFCNEKMRPAADLFAQLYYSVKSIKQEWDANNLGVLLPAANDNVVDGSASDGRHPITSNDVQALIGVINEFITNMEASSSQDLNSVLNIAVNPIR